MKIIKLVLHRYKRFDLLASDTITYTPVSPYQLVLGKNGIGKSSLLNELSPLPCETTDLKEEGYKEIEIEHRGHRYILRNTLQKKLENSFIMDGKELNESGTTRAQKDLVEEHFHYNSQLHDILMGVTLFSNMSPQQRREWFVKMSQSDMTYAIQLFNRIRSSERDIKGAIKVNNNRIVQEKNKLPDEATIISFRDQKKEIVDNLNLLLPNLDNDVRNVTPRIIEASNAIKSLAAQVVDSKFEMAWEGVADREAVIEIKHRMDYELERCKEDYRKVTDELAQVQDIIRKATEEQKRPISEIDNEIESLMHETDKLSQTIDYCGFTVAQDNFSEKLHFDKVKSVLSNVLMNLPANPRGENNLYRYDKSDYEPLRRLLAELGSEIQKRETEKIYLQRELDQLKQVHDVDCPNCHHTFKPGVDCSRMSQIEEKIKRLDQESQQYKIDYQEKKALEQEYDEWLRWLNALNNIPNQYPTSIPLINYLVSFELLQDNPRLLLQKVSEYERIVDLVGQRNQIRQYLDRLEQERTRTLAAEGNDMEFVYSTMKRLEVESEALQLKTTKLTQQVNQIRTIISNHDTVNNWEQQLTQLLKQIEDDTLMLVRFKNNEYLSHEIHALQQSLADKETFLKQVDQRETIISQLESTNLQLKEESEALSVLTKILSPQDGLIAESLLGFMNNFLDQLTNILDQVWTYSMRPYLDLGEEGIELDYRFPVDVNDGNIFVKDISRLSRGQMEMVNFGFKLLLMQYLDLQDYPLTMDEIGGSFDSLHRDKLYQYIKRLVESNQVQQVFIISHIASSHDALSQADRCILDPDTIMVNKEDNKVLQFN